MAVRKSERHKLRRQLISRTARVWSRLNKKLNKDLNEISQTWLKKLIKQAENDIASGNIVNVPDIPEKFTKILQKTLREALAYGYWLQQLYLYERRGKKYKGKITLSEGDEVKELLESFIVNGEWNDVIPEDAINWIKNYVPKLAGIFKEDVLEKTRDVMLVSLFEGSTLQGRIKELRKAAPELASMTQHRLEAIARTEITRADTLGRLISMKANDDVIGVEFSAIMDDRTTDICASRHGLVMRLDDPRLPENTPPLHVNCVLGDTFVLPVGRISAYSKRIFNGDVFIIKSATGNNLTCTPNHPILTGRGWIRACEIQEGDYVVCNAFGEGRNIINSKHKQVVSRIEDITSSFFDNGKMCATPVPVSAEDFHNDGGKSKIAIIYTQRKLLNRIESSIFKNVIKHNFIFRNIRCAFLKFCNGAFSFFFNRVFPSYNGFMSFLCKPCSFFRSGILHSYELLLMTIARFKAILKQYQSNSACCFNTETLCNASNTYTLIEQVNDSFLVNGIDRTFPLNAAFTQDVINLIKMGVIFFAKFRDGSTSEIIFDKVFSVDKRSFHGFVYNLQTESSVYFADNILTHNCRSLLLALTVYDYPDGLLTSHEFEEIPRAIQRPEDIEEVRKILEGKIDVKPKIEEKVKINEEASLIAKIQELQDKKAGYLQEIDSLLFQIFKATDDETYDLLESRQQNLEKIVRDIEKTLKELKIQAADKGVILASGIAETLDKADVDNVIKLLKNASPDVRKVWNLHEDIMKIADTDYEGTSHYSPTDKSIYIQLWRDKMPYMTIHYRTIFHELGHLIDNADEEYYSKEGKFNLYDTLTSEVNSYIDTVLKRLKAQAASEGKDSESISIKDVHTAIQKELDKFSYDACRGLSDVFSGVTLNKVVFDAWHPTSYWERDRKKVCLEFFAETYSSSIVDPEAIEVLKKYIPKSYNIFTEILKDIIKRSV